MIKGYAKDRKVFINGVELTKEDSLELYNHSPCGFEWGYASSGPAQLSLAILMQFCNDDDALRLHQDFKTEIISQFKIDTDWQMPIKEVTDWIELSL